MSSDWWIYILLGVIVSLEFLLPNREYAKLTSERKENALWYLINEIVLVGVISAAAAFVGDIGHSGFRAIGASSISVTWSFWAQLFLFLGLFDFLNYWVHRILHTVPFLWKFHKLHHSTQELTALSAFRISPIELILHATVLNLLVSVIGFSPFVRGMGNFLFFSVCIVQHANLALRLPHWVDYILITPRNHRWHHSCRMYKTNGQNFGFIFSVWDRIFRTYHNPQECSDKFGLSESRYPTSVVSRFLYPLRVDYFLKVTKSE